MRTIRAATLIELLAAISIMGTLATLLLPAVQTARESARTTTCRNNLHQTGIALLNYESVRKHFPEGAEGRFDAKLSPRNMFGLSWWAELLAYLDESRVSDRLDRSGANTGWAYLNTQNGELADGFGPAFFFCPSSSVDHFVKSGEYRIACPSYSGISGATNDNGFRESRVSRCCRSEGQISAGGTLVPNTAVLSSQITDGLANTLIVGEQSDFAYSDSGDQMIIGPAFYLGWLCGTSDLGVPPKYVSWLAPSYNLTSVRYSLNERRYDLPGVYLDHGANNPLLSPHPDIVNLLFCDGSVRGYEDSMDIDVLKSLATRDDSVAEKWRKSE